MYVEYNFEKQMLVESLHILAKDVTYDAKITTRVTISHRAQKDIVIWRRFQMPHKCKLLLMKSYRLLCPPSSEKNS